MKRTDAFSALLFSLLLGSCGGEDTPTAPTPTPTPVATSITLSATSLSFSSLGETSQLSATVKDQNEATMSGASVTWSSSSASVATVSSTGLVTAVANGTTTITATSGSASANSNASIQQVAVSITLSPDSLVFAAPGDTATVMATILDAGGSEVTSPNLTWSSSDTTTATVDSSGVVTGVASGPAATVKAQTDDQEAEISTRVKLGYMDVAVTGDGDPVPDVPVWLTDPTGTNTKKTTTSAGGVVFRNLQPGEHTVTLQPVPTGLMVTNPQTVQVNEDQGHDLVFTGLFAPAQITGTAKSWGTPVEGAVVRIEGKDTVEVTVNSAGVFQVDSIRRGGSGAYTFTISNYSGVRFKETTLTETVESGANTADFIGRPDPEPTLASITGGAHYTCTITTEDEAYCWGENNYGQLGDDTITDHLLPVLVSGLHSWGSITAGNYHTCGVTTAGQAYCWGSNADCQLGISGSTCPDHTVPTLVSGGYTWALLTGGVGHTCGVTTTGQAYCWGSNLHGQLGDGTTTHRTIPTLVNGGHNWASVTGGRSHTCGVTTGGEAYCWGFNRDGNLGDGTTTHRTIPTLVNGGHNWASVTGGNTHSCGVTTLSKAYCWGRNSDGHLGDGTTTNRSVPTLVSRGFTNWVSVDGGEFHSCGVIAGGAAYCWGRNRSGKLGDGTTNQRTIPTLVNGGHNWASVWGSGGHTCGVTTGGEGYCWGNNGYGARGDGTTTKSSVPIKVGGNW